MASLVPPTNATLAATLSARCKTLINNDLKKICKEEGQNVSGNKPQLQGRVLARTLHPTSLLSLPLLSLSHIIC
jgi:hypothetical protein